MRGRGSEAGGGEEGGAQLPRVSKSRYLPVQIILQALSWRMTS